jgi:hypothetical protein
MKLDVPDKFLHLVEALDDMTNGKIIIGLMKWASANPREAEEAVDDYSNKLGRNAKSHFRSLVFWTGKLNPTEGVRRGREIELEQIERRKWLAKAMADMRRGGYKVVMPNRVECVITKQGEKYVSQFTVQNVQVTLIGAGSGIAAYIEGLRAGKVYLSAIDTISLNGRTFDTYSKQGKMIAKAIVNNTNPFVNAVLSS